MIEFMDLDLRIGTGITAGYSIKAKGADEELARAPLNQASLASLEPDLGMIRDGMADRAVLERAGTALFQALFPLQVLVAYSAAQAQVEDGGGLRLRLHLPPELTDLPWELLYYPPTFLAAEPGNSIVRFVELPETASPLVVQPPLKVLHMVTPPEGEARPDGEGKAGYLSSILADLTARGVVEIINTPSGTLSALQEGLNRSCHVLHFSGQVRLSGGEAHLLWEDEAGGVQRLSGEELGDLLRGTTLRLVFLAPGEPGSAQEGVASLLAADALVRGGLPAAMAYQAPMPEDSSAAFTTVFYNALAEGLPVDIAVGRGREAVMALLGASASERGDWAALALFTSVPEGQILVFETAEKQAGRAAPAASWQISQETYAEGDAATIGEVRGGEVNIRFGDTQAAKRDMPPPVDTAPYAAIRALLLEAYTPTTLRSFCQDRPAFRPVVNDFGPGQGLNDMVARVLDYCGTQFLWHELLAAVREDNPRQYARYEGRLRAAAESLSSRPVSTEAVPVDPLLQCLKDLRRTVRAFAPRGKRAEALAQVAALKEASTGQDLDLKAMAEVLHWFEEELPALSGAALSAVLAAESRAEAAGDEALLEFQDRFGGSR